VRIFAMIHRAVRASLAVALFSFACPAPTAAMVGDPGLEAAARIIDAEAARHPNGSMTVAIVVRGDLAWVRSYGFADAQGQVPATPDTVYRIGSITKQVTGFALLRLVADGGARLDDPVVRLVPELRAALGDPAAPVDLLALATHRAGLAREPDDPDHVYSTGQIDQWRALASEALQHTRAPFAPNDRGRYSNIGYAALGLAIERASGSPYVDFVHDRITAPLGMSSTTFHLDDDGLARLAVGYRSSAGTDTAEAASEVAGGRGYRVPNGGLFSTAADLARFMAFEMGKAPRSPIHPALVADNFNRRYPAVDGGLFGVGFAEVTYGQRRLVGHSGLTTGYASSAYFDPDEQIGVICLGSAEDMCQSRFIDVYAALSPAWLPVAEARRAEQAAIALRVREQQPYEQGEAVLRQFIARLADGRPDYDRLGPVLGDAVRDNLALLQGQFSALGPVHSIEFAGVESGGADVYRVRFADSAMEWRITLTGEGVLETATMRPAP